MRSNAVDEYQDVMVSEEERANTGNKHNSVIVQICHRHFCHFTLADYVVRVIVTREGFVQQSLMYTDILVPVFRPLYSGLFELHTDANVFTCGW